MGRAPSAAQSVGGTATLVRGLYWSSLAVVGLASVLRVVSPSTVVLGYAVLAIWAWKGRVETIQALAVSWFLTMLHPSLAPATEACQIGHILVLIAAIASSTLRSLMLRRRAARVGTLSLMLVLVVHAALVSSDPEISVFKTILWGAVLLAILTTWASLTPTERTLAERSVFGLLLVIALASLPLLPLTIGRELNARDFQGLFSHPQAFGVAMALLAVWSLLRFLGARTPPWWLLASFALATVLLLLSGSRGAAIVIGAAPAVATGVLVAVYRGRSRQLIPGLVTRRAWALCLGLALGLFFLTHFQEWIVYFASKGGDELGHPREMFNMSRGLLLERMWANIRTDPWVGLGFGLPSDPLSMEVLRDPWFSLPISAPAEKGMAWLAIVEEVGVPVAGLFYWWLFLQVRRSMRGGVAPLGVVLSVLLASSYESIFFSPGGMGLLALLLFGWGVTAAPIAGKHSSTV